MRAHCQSALMIGSRELLDSLRERDRLSLGKGLDFIVQKYQWDILAHFKDQEIRDRLAEDLSKYVEEKIPEWTSRPCGSRGGLTLDRYKPGGLQMHEYKFVRLGERRILGVRPTAEDEYQKIVHEHAKEGWRLVQIFAPGLNPYGRTIYFELIFERAVKD